MAAPLEAAICYFSHCFPLGRLVFVTPCWDVDGPPDLMIIFLWNSPLPLLFIEPESSWIYMIVCIWSLHAYHQADTHIIHIGVTDVVTKIKQPSDKENYILTTFSVLKNQRKTTCFKNVIKTRFSQKRNKFRIPTPGGIVLLLKGVILTPLPTS